VLAIVSRSLQKSQTVVPDCNRIANEKTPTMR
jgi:hypothetical protein